jgi:hypothetical protein
MIPSVLPRNPRTRVPRNRLLGEVLVGAPTLPDDIAKVLQRTGALNEEQERRANAAIEIAAADIKRRAWDATRDPVPFVEVDDGYDD